MGSSLVQRRPAVCWDPRAPPGAPPPLVVQQLPFLDGHACLRPRLLVTRAWSVYVHGVHGVRRHQPRHGCGGGL